MPRRPRWFATAVSAAALAAITTHVRADSEAPFAAPRVVLGAGAGAMHVDLPDREAAGDAFGTRPLVLFDLGLEARPWLEIGAELDYTYLQESDSLNAALAAQGSDERGLRTLVQATLDARLRWLHGASCWAPFLRAGAGVAAFYTHAGDLVQTWDTDPAWAAGAGLDWYPHRHILLRGEIAYRGQTTDGETAHHAAGTLAIHYAVHRGQLGL
jgi:hypothetical protein